MMFHLAVLLLLFGNITWSYNVPRSFFATTTNGFEPVLAKEISALPDVQDIRIGKGSVSFTGSSRSGFSGLLWLRTSLKLMEKLGDSQSTGTVGINSKDDLYDFVAKIEWTSLIEVEKTLKCSCVLGVDVARDLTHSHFSSLTAKNAIIDQFRDKYNRRPNVDLERPHLPLLLYLHQQQATIYRVWSGEESMHKRGYKADSVIHKANLRENTAASLLMLAKLQAGQPTVVVDPMCGSGTFLIEAALIASNTAPGLIKYPKLLKFTSRVDSSSHQPVPLHWKDVDPQHWSEAWHDAMAQDNRYKLRVKKKEPLIFGNDIDSGAVTLARKAAKLSGVDHLIQFSHKDIENLDVAILEASSSTSTAAILPNIVSRHDSSVNNTVKYDFGHDSSPPRTKGNALPVIVITNPPWDIRLPVDNHNGNSRHMIYNAGSESFSNRPERSVYSKLSSFLEKCRNHFGLLRNKQTPITTTTTTMTHNKVKATAYILSGKKDLKNQLHTEPNQIKRFRLANEDVEWLSYHLN